MDDVMKSGLHPLLILLHFTVISVFSVATSSVGSMFTCRYSMALLVAKQAALAVAPRH
jgi:hypothetical protein